MISISNSGWQSGVRDWLLQRLSGAFICIYFFFIISYLYFNGGLTYSNWNFLFSCFYFKIVTILFIFNLSMHSSIGMTVVLTDYVKNALICIMLEVFMNLVLLSYIFSIMQVLWGF